MPSLLAYALYDFNRVLMNQWHHLQTIAPSPIPRVGPGVIVSNHISWLDPAILQSTCSRPITFMMAKDMTEQFGLRWVKHHFPILPVSGTARDSSSFKSAIRLLNQGELLGIFPEGALARDHQFLPFQPGTALIAQRAAAPIYPVAINGSNRSKAGFGVFLKPQRILIRWGEPLRLDRSLQPELAIRQVESVVHALLPATTDTGSCR